MIHVNIQLKRDHFTVKVNETFDNGITGIYGHSGSGKTSLLNCIVGIERPQMGEIVLFDRTIFNVGKKINIPVHKRNIGYVFQEGRLFPHMTVRKNLNYGRKLNGENKLNFDDVVDLLQLRNLLDCLPNKISGGERQRTALGRALLSNPKLLLMDEPFSAVDMQHRDQILPYLLKIHQKIAIPIFVISHDLPDLLKLTNKLCILQKGKVIEHNQYHQLLKSPKLQEFFHVKSLLNTIEMKLNSMDHQNGLAKFDVVSSRKPTVIYYEIGSVPINKLSIFQAFIKADDIALSNSYQNEITIQNQIEGQITDTIDRGNIVLCIVDIGIPLVVEITNAARNRLCLTIGKTVWCLFKSVAIDLVK